MHFGEASRCSSMARPLRIEFPGAFYHVMNRGNAGMDIFSSRIDQEKFLEEGDRDVYVFKLYKV